MLALLRTSRRFLAGALGLLVVGSWLSVAAAACVVDGPAASDMVDHAGMGQSMEQSMGDCPHCDTADAPCIDDRSDCDIPVGIIPAQPEEPDAPALIESTMAIPVVVNAAPMVVPHASPPSPSGRMLHLLNCSFQE